MSTANATEEAYPDAGYSWYVAGVLAALYTLSNVDRQVLGLLVEPIRADLGVSDTMMGLLGGFAFAVFYTVMGLPIARLADHGSRRAVIAAGVVFWSAATIACGGARTFVQLFLARVGVAVGEAALTPASYSLLADYFPPSRLTRAMAVYALGAALGYGLAYLAGGALFGYFARQPHLALPLLGEIEPWQATFIAVGAPGLLMALLMLTVAEPPRRNAPQAKSPKDNTALFAFLRQNGAVLSAHFGGLAAYTIASTAFNMWLPTHYIRAYGWTPEQVGIAFGAMIIGLGVIGVLSAGYFGDKIKAKAGRASALFNLMAWWTVLATVPLTLASLMPTAQLSLILLAPGAFLVAGPVVIAPTVLQLVTPNALRAQVSAIYLFVIALLGMGLGPLLVGVVTDHVFGDPSMLKWSIALVAGAALTLSCALLFLGGRLSATPPEPAP